MPSGVGEGSQNMIYTFSISIPSIQRLKQTALKFLEKKYLRLDSFIFKKTGLWFWRFVYRLTGSRCGSLASSHYPVFGNDKQIWTYHEKDKKVIYECKVCGYTDEVNRAGASFKNYSRTGREADMSNLIKMRKTATNSAEKKAVDHAMHKINNEEKHVKAMREDLIKVTRANDHNKIKEIHDYVGTHKKHQNE